MKAPGGSLRGALGEARNAFFCRGRRMLPKEPQFFDSETSITRMTLVRDSYLRFSEVNAVCEVWIKNNNVFVAHL